MSPPAGLRRGIRQGRAGLSRQGRRPRGRAGAAVHSGRGFTVREVIAAAARVTNRAIPMAEGPRRPGDAAWLVSGSARAYDELGWRPRRSGMDQMIGDAWR